MDKEKETKLIIEEYNINGKKYSIKYLEDSKAIDVFTSLNRMIASGKSFDIFNGVSINEMYSPIISIPIEKKKWWKI